MALTPKKQNELLAPNALAPLSSPRTTATTAPGTAGGSVTGGALLPTTPVGGSVPSPTQPVGTVAPASFIPPTPAFTQQNGAIVDPNVMSGLSAEQQAQLQQIMNRDPSDTSPIPLWASDALTQMFTNAAGQGYVDTSNASGQGPQYVDNSGGQITAPLPPLRTNTPEEIRQHAIEQFRQVPGADAYGFQFNQQTGQTEAAPGFAAVTGPGGATMCVRQENAPAAQQAFDSGNVTGGFDVVHQDGSIPGYSTRQPDGSLQPIPQGTTFQQLQPTPAGQQQGQTGQQPTATDSLADLLQQIISGGGGTSTGGAILPTTGDLSGTAFGPGNNLIGTQISPTDSDRLAGIQGMVDSAAQNLAGGLGDTSPFAAGPDAQRARALTMQGLESLFSGPDRASLAADALGIFDERSAEAQELALRNAGNAAAKFGRLGSGNVATSIGDYELARQRDRDLLQRDLALNAAQQTMSDRQAQLSGALGVGNSLFGQDLSGAQFGLDRALADYGVRADTLGALAGLEGMEFGQGLTERNELRGERDFQYGLSRDALQDRLNEVLLEDQLLNSSFGRDQRRLESLLPLLTYDPLTGAQQNASDYYGNRSADQQAALWNLLFNAGAS